MSRRAIALGLGIVAAVGSTASAAFDITRDETALLPEMCRHTQVISSNNSVTYDREAAKWLAYMGPGFWAMHHYCWGLVRLMRADRASSTPQERIFWRETSLNEFNYVLQNTTEDFVFRADILAKEGEVLHRLSRNAEAAQAYEAAIALRKDFEAAWYGLAEAYAAQGKTADALATIDAGLKEVTDPRFLPKQRERLAKKR